MLLWMRNIIGTDQVYLLNRSMGFIGVSLD